MHQSKTIINLILTTMTTENKNRIEEMLLSKIRYAEKKIADLEEKRDELYPEYVEKRQKQLRRWIEHFSAMLERQKIAKD